MNNFLGKDSYEHRKINHLNAAKTVTSCYYEGLNYKKIETPSTITDTYILQMPKIYLEETVVGILKAKKNDIIGVYRDYQLIKSNNTLEKNSYWYYRVVI